MTREKIELRDYDLVKLRKNNHTQTFVLGDKIAITLTDAFYNLEKPLCVYDDKASFRIETYACTPGSDRAKKTSDMVITLAIIQEFDLLTLSKKRLRTPDDVRCDEDLFEFHTVVLKDWYKEKTVSCNVRYILEFELSGFVRL